MSRPDHVATCEQEIRDAVLHALGNPRASELLFKHREAERLCARKVHAALTKLCARVAADVRREMIGRDLTPELLDRLAAIDDCVPDLPCDEDDDL